MQRNPLTLQIMGIIGSLESIAKPRLNYPPMDIIRTSDTSVELHFAVAGFSQDSIEITTENNVLRIKGSVHEAQEPQYVVRGIAKRAFDHSFKLSPIDKVVSANYVDGLLKIKLEAVIPEDQKQKSIPIG